MNQQIKYLPVKYGSEESTNRIDAYLHNLNIFSTKRTIRFDDSACYVESGNSLLVRTSEGIYSFDWKQVFDELSIEFFRPIKYSPEWIDKILSGEKTMTIRRTQYLCGIYDVVNEITGEVVCQIEITKAEKWDTEYWLKEMQVAEYNMTDIFVGQSLIAPNDDEYIDIQSFPCFAKLSGFNSVESFIEYHRNNYAPVKYAHTFNLVKGNGQE